MSQRSVRVAVTGAAGQIGYALVFRIAAGEMFGPSTAVQLNLLELKTALPVLEGVRMELDDCAFPLLESVNVTTDAGTAFRDADWALLVGSVPRKAGMERKELLSVNGGIFVEQGRALDEEAKDSCRVLVVGNPCNTNAFIAKSVAKRIPARQFFAMTMLDHNRAVSQLAAKARVPVSSVRQMAVWGNHSATQFPDFYHARIQGRPAPEVIGDEEWLKTAFLQTVQKRGASVIKARGSSSAASAANAVVDTVRCLEMDTPEGECFSTAVVSDGSYGVPEGLVFSFPLRTRKGEWKIIQGVEHNTFAKERISLSLKELEQEREIVLPGVK